MSHGQKIWNSVITNVRPSPEQQRKLCSHLSAESPLVFGHHLGGHEGRGPRRARQEGVGPLELVAHAKVGDLDVTVVPQQQVGGFDVSVDDLVVVHWTK